MQPNNIKQDKEKYKMRDYMHIVLTVNTEPADQRIKALRKANTVINDFINDYLKTCRTPPQIQGRGISPHILKLFKE